MSVDFFNFLDPATWLPPLGATDSDNLVLMKPAEWDLSAMLERAADTYHQVDELRPKVSTASHRVSVFLRPHEEQGIAHSLLPIHVEDLTVPYIYNMTMLRVTNKLEDFYNLRYNLCSTAAAESLGRYSEKPNSGGFFMRVPTQKEVPESLRSKTSKVLITLLDELNVVGLCIKEVLRWVNENERIILTVDLALSLRHMYVYLWRSLSLSVVLAQCLQIVCAYFIHVGCECHDPEVQQEKYVGVVGDNDSTHIALHANKEIAILHVERVCPN